MKDLLFRKTPIVPLLQRKSYVSALRRSSKIAEAFPLPGKDAAGIVRVVEQHYIVVDQKTFAKEDLVLDNHVYKNCQMDKCRIYYSGGPFELIDTHITESELILNQPARNIYTAIQIFRTKSPGSTIVFE
jgi:hypothetical protein